MKPRIGSETSLRHGLSFDSQPLFGASSPARAVFGVPAPWVNLKLRHLNSRGVRADIGAICGSSCHGPRALAHLKASEIGSSKRRRRLDMGAKGFSSLGSIPSKLGRLFRAVANVALRSRCLRNAAEKAAEIRFGAEMQHIDVMRPLEAQWIVVQAHSSGET